MKKIIGNLLYDTEKAEKIYSFMQKRKISSCILDKYENSYNDYQTLIEELSDEGFKVLFVDDNEIFEFEETHDIDYSFINEEEKEDG